MNATQLGPVSSTATNAGRAYEAVVLKAGPGRNDDLSDLRDTVHIPQLGQFARDLDHENTNEPKTSRRCPMKNYPTMEAAQAGRAAVRQARVSAAQNLRHVPTPVDGDTARALIAATGYTANGITISAGDNIHSPVPLIAIGHYDPAEFMAAVHAITAEHDAEDPFGLFDSLYGEIYLSDIEFNEMADWGTEDVQHAYALVLEHGNWDGPAETGSTMDPENPAPAECQCITHTWSIRQVLDATPGALPITVWRDGEDESGFAFGPQRDPDGDGES
ncbi:hypothetical protein Caci_2879 [Catenulispora acidiphila DSM 44928]|uniref:Uncharacterized protein n=1 Tax=Catenulispora acidiphila (strain DSM 44928 / JCM 14897 / NBRC 102108 / NRRL B-24433 / ID139908) TaxID=479433 RepID=C7Q2P6_CATAD|nr:hypothetical protein [Catenulispora acidiphila]ACU71788.1 hypothetical protein Caci_2879 [Catenulispora acidiphila DSM 44928]